MEKSKPQPANPRQVQQFLADAQKRAITAKKNLPIDADAAYQIAYEAMIKGSLALMLSHGQRPRAMRVGVAGGWHTHLAILEDVLEGRTPAAFWTTFNRWDAEYEQRIPVDAPGSVNR